MTEKGDFRFIHSYQYWKEWVGPERDPNNPEVRHDVVGEISYVVLDGRRVNVIVSDHEPRDRKELAEEPNPKTIDAFERSARHDEIGSRVPWL